jgi:hypothetical protein
MLRRDHDPGRLIASTISLALLMTGCFQPALLAAENLRLKEGISFYHDVDLGFPIVADKLDDVTLSSTHPTVLFFGAAGDLNTNRQAKRIVDLYHKFHSQGVKFVVIDVDRPANQQAKDLIKAHYQGYIPTQVIFDSAGKSKWSKTGEIELPMMASQLDKLL